MINIKEKIYTKAFEDGVNYAIQKMFGEEEEEEKKKKKLRNKLIAAGVGTAALATGLGIYLAKKGKGKINYKNNSPLDKDPKFQ